MVRRWLIVCCALLAMSGAALAAGPAFAAGPAKGNKPAAKVVEVKVCPITLQPAKDPKAPTTVVGKYRVHFCCPSCKPTFDKLPKAQQLKKIQAAMKVQAGRKAR